MSSICVRLLRIYIVKSYIQVVLNVCFFQTQIEYLGHVIGSGVFAVDPTKTYAIIDWPEPAFVKHIKQFLGLANYSKYFV